MRKDDVFKRITNVFGVITIYYNYPYINIPIRFDNDLVRNVSDRACALINEECKKISFITKEFDSSCDTEKNVAGAYSIYNNTKGYVDIISLAYRFLEEIGMEELVVKISNYDNVLELTEYLDYMDIDYEIDKKVNSDTFSFEISSEYYLNIKYACGGVYNNKVGFKCYIDELVKVLDDGNKTKPFLSEYNICDVFIEAHNHEEELVAFNLVQQLRLSELLVELDLGDNSEYKSRMNIQLNKDDLQKGLIKVIDNVTHEEELVDEAEIIDYIVSNL